MVCVFDFASLFASNGAFGTGELFGPEADRAKELGPIACAVELVLSTADMLDGERKLRGTAELASSAIDGVKRKAKVLKTHPSFASLSQAERLELASHLCGVPSWHLVNHWGKLLVSGRAGAPSQEAAFKLGLGVCCWGVPEEWRDKPLVQAVARVVQATLVEACGLRPTDATRLWDALFVVTNESLRIAEVHRLGASERSWARDGERSAFVAGLQEAYNSGDFGSLRKQLEGCLYEEEPLLTFKVNAAVQTCREWVGEGKTAVVGLFLSNPRLDESKERVVDREFLLDDAAKSPVSYPAIEASIELAMAVYERDADADRRLEELKRTFSLSQSFGAPEWVLATIEVEMLNCIMLGGLDRSVSVVEEASRLLVSATSRKMPSRKEHSSVSSSFWGLEFAQGEFWLSLDNAFQMDDSASDVLEWLLGEANSTEELETAVRALHGKDHRLFWRGVGSAERLEDCGERTVTIASQVKKLKSCLKSDDPAEEISLAVFCPYELTSDGLLDVGSSGEGWGAIAGWALRLDVEEAVKLVQLCGCEPPPKKEDRRGKKNPSQELRRLVNGEATCDEVGRSIVDYVIPDEDEVGGEVAKAEVCVGAAAILQLLLMGQQPGGATIEMKDFARLAASRAERDGAALRARGADAQGKGGGAKEECQVASAVKWIEDHLSGGDGVQSHFGVFAQRLEKMYRPFDA